MTTTINASTTAGLVQTADTSGVLALQTAGTTAISISAAQVVSLTSGLAVTGTLSATGLATLASSQITGATFPASGSGLELVFQGGISKLQSFNRTGSVYLPMTLDGTTVDILSSGNTKGAFSSTGFAVTGLVDISAATSGQIKFPATQNASTNLNTLDDYEEGTWTPNQGGGLTVVGTFSSSGAYTKIGKLVTVQVILSATTSIAITAGDAVMFTNLPFASSPNRNPGVAVNTAHSAGLFVNIASTTVYSCGTIAASATIFVSVTYQTS